MEIDSDENCGFMVGPELDDAFFFFFGVPKRLFHQPDLAGTL